MSELLSSYVDQAQRDDFFEAYVKCGQWSSEHDGESLDHDGDFDRIAVETLMQMRADCNRFYRENREWIGYWHDDDKAGQAGHDFWLTRNGHGVGFWDGDWPEPAATKLSDASKAFGEYMLYIGDDGKIHGS